MNPLTRPLEAESVRLEQVVEEFEIAWKRGSPPTLNDFLPNDPYERRSALPELIHTDLECRFKSGHITLIESYLDAFPELASDSTTVVDLLLAEFDLRRRFDTPPNPTEYGRRFPEYAGEISRRLPSTYPEHGPKPARIGKYVLHEEVGQGACGIVYRAHDPELDRTVAIKIPGRQNLMTQEERLRFRREGRSAAQLHHPGIVEVFDVGEIDGVCFLVSEFVNGTNLAKRLAADRLGFSEAAALVARMAEALHYAHQQGVIHRDIKPANVLIALDHPVGSPLLPKIADFGLAKRENQDATLTHSGQVLGTPAYLSPEQARGESHRVGPRSDTYSLGAILYEMLTGELVFRGSVRMVLQQVLDDEPRAPRALNDQVPRDLEVICLKCLEKDPTRRYADAAALAADLRRFLAGEPIHARPVGRIERLGRWCRRKPLVAGLAAAVVVAVLVGFIGVVAQWRRAETMRLAAEQHAERESQVRERAVNAEQRAKRRFQEVQGLARAFMFDFSDHIDKLADAMPARRFLVQEGVAYLEKLATEDGDDPVLLWDLAHGYRQIGDLQGHPHKPNLGNSSAALDSYRKSLDFAEAAAKLEPDHPKSQRSVLMSRMEIAEIHWLMGRGDDARAGYRKCLELAETAARKNPSDMLARYDLVVCRQRVGDLHQTLNEPLEALAHYERMRSVAEALRREKLEPAQGWANRSVSISLQKVADAQAALGMKKEALENYRKALALAEENALNAPKDTGAQRILLVSLTNVGTAEANNGRPAHALTFHQRALGIAETLAQADSKNVQSQWDLASGLDLLGQVLTQTGQPAKGLEQHTRAMAIMRGIVEADQDNAQARSALALSCEYMGDALVALGKHEEAHARYEEGVELIEQLVKSDPASAATRQALANLCYKIGDFCVRRAGSSPETTLDRSRQWRCARESYRRARDLVANLPQGASGSLTLAELDGKLSHCERQLQVMSP
jgi:serine/threonine-protein kinase